MSSKPPPVPMSARMTVTDTVKHMKWKYNVTVTRQTVYNWIKFGVGGIKLRIIHTPRGLRTQEAWIEEFHNTTK